MIPWLYLWRSRPFGWGRACVKGTGIQTAVIYDRWVAGESVVAIAQDYGLGRTAIEQAIVYELGRRDRYQPGSWKKAMTTQGAVTK